jgi:hypothetical protein
MRASLSDASSTSTVKRIASPNNVATAAAAAAVAVIVAKK